MSAPVLIGFAGVLVAAVVTGMLAGLCARRPRIDLVLWALAALGLTVALAAQSVGFAEGFGTATFLAVQLSVLLLVPLWLSWGLVEFTGNEAARFGMRLASGALTGVAGLIVATDPLTALPFSKAWPLTGQHSQPVSGYALDAVEGVAVTVALLVAGLVAARARAMLAAAGPIALAVLLTAGLRASLPAKSGYPLLSMMAAALVWFGVTRAQNLPGPEGENRRLPRDAPDPRGRGPGYRQPAADDAGARRAPDDAGARRAPDDAGARRAREQDWRRGTPPPVQARPPSVQVTPPGGGAAAETETGAAEREAGAKADPGAKPYGRLLIFTLLEDRVADFDRLAEQTAEQVRTGEPDTLVYVIHLVPNAPLQRIFYEIYRDRSAFESHENQPYMKRFVADRRSWVLATNSIELRLKYAKVAPLPNPQPAGVPGPPRTRTPLPPRPPRPQSAQRPMAPPPMAPPPMAPPPLAPLPPDPRDRRPPADPRERRRPSPDPRYGGI